MKHRGRAAIKKKLWSLCRQIIAKRHGTDCYTCEAQNLQGSNKQLGHFIPSSVGGAGLRYDLRNLRFQCMVCNIHRSGNWPAYYSHMVEEVGEKAIKKLLAEKNNFTKADMHFYKNKVLEYEKEMLSLS